MGVGVEVEGKGVAVGSFLRKRRALNEVRSGPQMGSVWISAPGMRSMESFFKR